MDIQIYYTASGLDLGLDMGHLYSLFSLVTTMKVLAYRTLISLVPRYAGFSLCPGIDLTDGVKPTLIGSEGFVLLYLSEIAMSRNTKETSLIHPGEREMSTSGRHHGRLDNLLACMKCSNIHRYLRQRICAAARR